ncbi:cysteine desulfurase family protein [Ruminococcus flavefaciens]|uniref:cysteine desulfurase n=1 Tax=Ruminococcus flavefaciens TaxID=1265 RepID=A0A1M7IGM1_RUMFL|nr:cysteine desulfurase family protein [Ruminococcus flavefaciens]SEH74042.1 cysteine desulfurase [Ruminococcus flavefaciens]SHM39805.1 cysteine desulfurase [Ruminococcus flavefaciens]
MKQFIYADNAATTKLDPVAYEAMLPWLKEEYANASQPYSFARSAKKAIAEARSLIARCINAEPEEIFFTSGGTESDNWAIKGAAFADTEHRAMITSQIEHHAVLRSCEAIERLGYPVIYLPVNKDGTVLPETLEQNITDNTRLVSVMFANNEIGTIQPIKDLVRIAHKHGTIFHTDAVQAVGHIPIDVQELGVDLLSASAHKFNGPKGIGFLYIRQGTSIVSFMDGGSQENALRAGTENVAAIVGMATALKENCDHLNENIEHIHELENQLITAMNESGVQYVRNGGNTILPGLLSLSFMNQSGETMLHRLDLKGIAISTGAACNGDNDEISHVLQAINLKEEFALGTIRVSIGKQCNEGDISEILNSLKQIIKIRH